MSISPVTEQKLAEIEPAEARELGAADSLFFSRVFFPKAFRQPSPDFHRNVWDALEGPDRFVSLQIYRGAAKTTTLRAFTAKRISYGLSHTIMYVGKSEDHAINSIRWLKNNVEKNERWTAAFGLKPGSKWTDTEIQIHHGVDDYPITVLGLGMTGSVRGINVEDYRPDLIILDDVIDDENAATGEQRNKVNERIFGAIKESLTPPGEDPSAKMVMLQTPIDRDDASEQTQHDPEWKGLSYGCFDEDGNSRWPEREPTDYLQRAKQSAINRNQLSVWLREKECVVTADEKRYFRAEWLQYWEQVPDGMTTYIGIDPSPPNDEEPEKRKKKEPDPEVLEVWGVKQGNYYLLEVVQINDPNPARTVSEFFRLVQRWQPLMAGVETVAYQASIKWTLEQAMQKQNIWVPIQKIDDKRKKTKRIRQAYVNIASSGKLYVHRSHTEFVNQFVDYPDASYDDVLDAGAIAISLIDPAVTETEVLPGEQGEEVPLIDESDIPELPEWRGAP